MNEEPRDDPSKSADDLVRFWRALAPAARREYEALAQRDREFGEDVMAEQRDAGVAGTSRRGA